MRYVLIAGVAFIVLGATLMGGFPDVRTGFSVIVGLLVAYVGVVYKDETKSQEEEG